MKTKLFASLLALGFALPASAAVLIYEPFDMNTGDLNGTASTGSTGLTGNWSDTNTHTVTSGDAGTGYGDLPSAGNHIVTTASNGGTDANTSTSISSNIADGESIWFSLIIQGGVTSNAHSGFSLGTQAIHGQYNGVLMQNSGDGIGFYYQGSTFRAAYWNDGSLVDSTDAESSNDSFSDNGEPTLIVGEITWGAGASGEQIDLYKVSLTDLSNKGSVLSSISTVNLDNASFDTLSYTTRGSAGGDIYDEIRFGQSYDDVVGVPEPSAAILGGLGALCFLRRRRRA